jgi:hypothetical protein
MRIRTMRQELVVSPGALFRYCILSYFILVLRSNIPSCHPLRTCNEAIITPMLSVVYLPLMFISLSVAAMQSML